MRPSATRGASRCGSTSAAAHTHAARTTSASTHRAAAAMASASSGASLAGPAAPRRTAATCSWVPRRERGAQAAAASLQIPKCGKKNNKLIKMSCRPACNPCFLPCCPSPPQCVPSALLGPTGPTGPTGPSGPNGPAVAFTVNSQSPPLVFPVNLNPNINAIPLNFVQPGGVGSDAWDLISGQFTAPQSGLYLISPAVEFRNLDGAAAQQAIVQLKLFNSSGIAIISQKQSYVGNYSVAPFNGCSTIAWSQVIYLEAGDVIGLLGGSVVSLGVGLQIQYGTYPAFETGLSIQSLF